MILSGPNRMDDAPLGITTTRAPGPPAMAINLAFTRSVPPPPSTTSVPLLGPDDAWPCARGKIIDNRLSTTSLASMAKIICAALSLPHEPRDSQSLSIIVYHR